MTVEQREPSESERIVAEIRERTFQEARANFTFRVKKRFVAELREKCQQEGISMNSVVEELIRRFIDEGQHHA